jgi:hypothetical protein
MKHFNSFSPFFLSLPPLSSEYSPQCPVVKCTEVVGKLHSEIDLIVILKASAIEPLIPCICCYPQSCLFIDINLKFVDFMNYKLNMQVRKAKDGVAVKALLS